MLGRFFETEQPANVLKMAQESNPWKNWRCQIASDVNFPFQESI